MNVNGVLSETAEAIIGISKGSVIRQVLFVIYVSDLPYHLAAGLLLYKR